MFAAVKEAIALLLVPIILFLAWRNWTRTTRPSVPPWRNGLAVIALLILSMNWAVALVIDAPELLHHHVSWLTDLKWIVYYLSRPLNLAAILLALSLKSVSRLEAILAALVMFASWPGGYR
jgi:hypothetical protein